MYAVNGDVSNAAPNGPQSMACPGLIMPGFTATYEYIYHTRTTCVQYKVYGVQWIDANHPAPHAQSRPAPAIIAFLIRRCESTIPSLMYDKTRLVEVDAAQDV